MVEGIIGAGKTTFCTLFHKLLESKGIESEILFEPIEEDDPALRLFLSDCDKYAFFFQIHVMNKRLKLYKKALKLKQQGKVVIIDRSLRGDRVFEEMFYLKAAITDDEHQYYLQRVEDIVRTISDPDVILYLDVSIDDAIARIHKRNRLTEIDVYTPKYISDLKTIYERIIKLGDNVVVISNPNSSKIMNYKSDLTPALEEISNRLKV